MRLVISLDTVNNKIYQALFTLRREVVRKGNSANGMRRNREVQGMSLYTRKFESKRQNEDNMTWTTILSLVAAKRPIFQDPRIFRQAHLKRWV